MWLCGMVGLMSGKFARVLLSLQAIYSGEIPFPLSFPAVETLFDRSFSEFIQHLRYGIAGTAARVIRTIQRRWHDFLLIKLRE